MTKITIKLAYFDNKEYFQSDFEYLTSTPWSQKELLSEEFKSLGFYISSHPLNEYKDTFEQLNIVHTIVSTAILLKKVLWQDTIMSIQEKKKC